MNLSQKILFSSLLMVFVLAGLTIINDLAYNHLTGAAIGLVIEESLNTTMEETLTLPVRRRNS